ncbi:MAG: 50S ribosomal protein L17 [bacterium]
MHHHDSIRKFGRPTDQRRALLRSLAVSFIEKGKIQTTEAKAKSLRPMIEKMITKAKVGNLAARRLLVSKVGDKCADILIVKIAPEFAKRNGGYTRITKLAVRKSDAASMAQIDLVK